MSGQLTIPQESAGLSKKILRLEYLLLDVINYTFEVDQPLYAMRIIKHFFLERGTARLVHDCWRQGLGCVC